MRVAHFNSSRPWIGTKGPKRRRTTTLTFVLPQATRVIFTVNQVSPACLGIGHFSVTGHAGLNRVRFNGRLHGEQLDPGTYRISARTPSGRVVRRITLVLVDGSAPSWAELRTMRAANVCPSTPNQASSPTSLAAGSSVAGAAPNQELPRPKTPSLSGLTPPAPDINSGVLASTVEKTARAIQPALIALLALSILLLGLASAPRVAVADRRFNDMLARHRTEIAALGAVALVAVAITFFLV
jgi:hypothetical protein